MLMAAGPTLVAFVALVWPSAWSVHVADTDACDVGEGGGDEMIIARRIADVYHIII